MSHSRGAGADPDEIPGGVAAGEQGAGGDDRPVPCCRDLGVLAGGDVGQVRQAGQPQHGVAVHQAVLPPGGEAAVRAALPVGGGGDDQFRRADLGRDAQLGVGMGDDHAIV